MSDVAESLSEEQAVAQLDALEDTDVPVDVPVQPEETAPQEVDDAPAEGEEQPEQELVADEPPTFWKREHKEQWQKLPAELRGIVSEYESQRTAFYGEKTRQAADYRREADSKFKQLVAPLEERAKWWEQNGDRFVDSFHGRWAKVDFQRLAVDNPNEWARLSQQRDAEAAQYFAAAERAQHDGKIAAELAAAERDAARARVREQLAKDMPAEYGAPDKAKATDEALGKFLKSHGVAPELLAEQADPVFTKLAFYAMKYLEIRDKAPKLISRGQSQAASKALPRRVVPGASTNASRVGSGAVQEARDAFHRSNGNDREAAARLIALVAPPEPQVRKARWNGRP